MKSKPITKSGIYESLTIHLQVNLINLRNNKTEAVYTSSKPIDVHTS